MAGTEKHRERSAGGWSRRRLLGAGALGIASLGMAGCTTAPAVPAAPATGAPSPATATGGVQPPATASPPAPKYGGKLATIDVTFMRNLDPHVLNGGGGSVGSALCYSQLLTYKWGADFKPPSYVPGPDLADSWQQADDLTYLFKLHPGVKFHNIAPVNGREVVAEDVIYSFERVRALKTYAPLIASLSKMEAVDKLTLKLTLDKPNADFLESLCDYHLKVVAKEAVDRSGNLEQPPVIGTGAWLFDQWAPNQPFVAKRNPDYFRQGLPYADSIQVFPSTDSNPEAFRGGSVNFIAGLQPAQALEMQKAVPSAKPYFIPLDRGPDEIVLNTKLDAFKNLKVRQAINKAIDRDAIISTAHLGMASLGAGIALPSPVWKLPDDELKRLLARDVEGAKRLLREAGMESGLDLKCVVPNYVGGLYVAIAELIQANLRDINVRLTLETVDALALSQRKQSHQFDLYITSNGAATPNSQLYGFYYTDGPQNYPAFNNPALDKLIDQQAVLSRDPEGRRKVFGDIQRLVIDQAINLCLDIRRSMGFSAAEVMDLYPPFLITNHTEYWQTAWINK
jgi:peptide/nickel transport system substrate-binding protein